jgi:polyphosphate glucokinase
MKAPAEVLAIDVGGNRKKVARLPMGCRLGDNANALLGGFRLWEEP